jgi:hypothetical protein
MRHIELSRGLVALVDDEDFERVMAGAKWFAKRHRNTDYARRNVWIDGKRTTASMHRFITGAPASLVVDHIDGNGLNNQKSNLRLLTDAQNQINKTNKRKGCSSRFKGVSFFTSRGLWRATIQLNRKWTCLGCFPTEEQARDAYAAAAVRVHGEFAAPYVEADE